jgi:hypothetical protein
VEIALAWVRTLSSLAPFSIFADFCSILAMAIVIKDDYSSFQRLDKGHISPSKQLVHPCVEAHLPFTYPS